MIIYRNGEKMRGEADLSDRGQQLLLLGGLQSEPDFFYLAGADTESAEPRTDGRGGAYDSYVFLRPELEHVSRRKGKIRIFFRGSLLAVGFTDEVFMAETDGYLGGKFAAGDRNDLVLMRFFDFLLSGDTGMLQSLESAVALLEDEVIGDGGRDYNREIGTLRKELLRIKSYYEQLLDIFSDLSENENGFLGKSAGMRLKILSDRLDRLYRSVTAMQDYLSQVREEYQTQIDIRLSKTMQIFTVITSIFLPLSLIAGWYGMNLRMPEYGWAFGYPFVMLLSAAVTAVCLIIFKKNKWF